MAHYGEILDAHYDPRRDTVYPLFVEYFNDPVMTKIKDVNDYSMYMAKIHALLGVEYRYLVVFVHQDTLNVKSTEKLSNLQWISLQTRTLTDNHDIAFHSYNPRRLPGLMKTITNTSPNTGKYTYKVDSLPITITLIPKEKDGKNEYSSTGVVVTALETYNTIVNFL